MKLFLTALSILLAVTVGAFVDEGEFIASGPYTGLGKGKVSDHGKVLKTRTDRSGIQRLTPLYRQAAAR